MAEEFFGLPNRYGRNNTARALRGIIRLSALYNEAFYGKLSVYHSIQFFRHCERIQGIFEYNFGPLQRIFLV